MAELKKSGVDIDLGNKCSKRAFDLSKMTFKNRQGKPGAVDMDVDGLFSNMLDFNGVKIGIASDGIGTKIEVAERTENYRTLGYDLLAMVADDLAAGGFEPTSISNIIDCDFLDYDIIDQMMSGLREACDFGGVTITGGEIAELGNRMNGYGDHMHFNWCSTAIGILHKNLKAPFDGKAIQTGDSIISLRSRGFRSNGFSLIRKILSGKYGDKWHEVAFSENQTFGDALLTPALVYSPLITKILDANLPLKAAAHITGGGIPDNLSRVLKVTKTGALLDNLFPPHEIMRSLQNLGSIEDEFAYRYWNMGNGMLLVAASGHENDIVELASRSGYQAQLAGKVTGSGIVEIQTDTRKYSYEPGGK